MAPKIGNKDLDTIAQMLLDADQYKTELKDVAKAIRKHKREERDLKLVQDEFGKSTAKVEKAIKKQTKAVEEQTKQTKKLFQTFTDLKSAWSAGVQVVKMLWEGTDKLYTHGTRLAKMYAAQTISIEAASEATAGYLTNTQLLEAANMAAAFDLGFTEKQFANLARGATVAAQKIGGNVTQAIGDLITGLSRQSKKILDNLGILVDMTSATDAYARTLGKTAKELTEAERKQAFMNAALKDLKRLAGDAKLEVKSTGDAWAVMKNAFTDAADGIALFVAKSEAGKGTLNWLAQRAREISTGIGTALDPRTQKILEIREKRQALLARMQDLGIDPTSGAFKKGREPFFQADLKKSQARAMVRQYEALARQITRIRVEKEKQAAAKAYDAWRKAEWKKHQALTENLKKQQDAKKTGGKGGKAAPDLFEVMGKNASKLVERLQGSVSEAIGTVENRLWSVRQAWAGIVDAGGNSWKNQKQAWEDWAKAEEEAAKKRKQAWEDFVSTMEGHDSVGFIETLLPEEDYQKFLERMHGMSEVSREFFVDMMEGAHGMFTAMGKGLWSAIEGTKSFGDAMKGAFNAFLKTWGQQMTLKALEHTAAALGSLAYLDFRGFAQHGAAAVAYGVAAAAAGIGARLTASSKTASKKKSSDRGLGGASSATPRQAASATYIYNINTVGAHEDELAVMVANAHRRGLAMGIAA